MNARQHQTGLSLVELMVALVVGLLLLGGVIEIFVANKQTYRVADTSARIQENARFVAEILGHHIRMTGYRSDVTKDAASSFPVLGNTGTLNGAFTQAGQVISGTDGSIDYLTIRFLGNDDGSVKNCTGTTVSSNQIANQRFFVSNSVLRCGPEVFAQDGTSVKGYNAQPLIEGVENMQILYGIDTDSDGTANCYDSATHLNSSSPTACGNAITNPWNQVVVVRMTLTLQSAEDNTSVTSGNRLQRTYTTTIALRNRLP